MASIIERYSPSIGANDDCSSLPSAASCKKCVSRHMSMCSVLSENEINTVLAISKNITVPSKQIICNEGDAANYFYNIKDGCVRISKMLADGRRQIIGFMFPGDFFSLACANSYNYSAETITKTNLCQMPRTKLFQKFGEFPSLSQKVLDITRIELQITHDHMLLLGRKKAKEKLCSFLLAMGNKSLQILNIEENQIYLPMSRSDIADYLGLTIETVSRKFTILAKEKVILLNENHFVDILDLNRLKFIASGE